MSSGAPTLYFPWITVLRGIFITWIFLRHFAAYGGPAKWASDAIPGFSTFDVPTTCFFVLAGLVFSLVRAPGQGWQATSKFWISRVGRLYPLYAITVLICAPIGWVAAGGRPGAFIAGGVAELTLTHGWFQHPDYPLWLFTGWFMVSLAFCYLVYPLIAPAINALGCCAAALALLCAAYAFGVGIYLDKAAMDPEKIEYIRRLPASSLPLFGLGICFGTLLRQGYHRLAVGIAGILFAASICVLFFMTPRGWHLFVSAPLWPLILILAIRLKTVPPKWMVSYGNLGFTIYMLHWPLLMYSNKALKLLGLESFIASPLYLILLVGMLVPLANWVHHSFERPVQASLKSWPVGSHV